MIAADSRMDVLRPKRLKDALTMMRDEGPLLPLAGGTDVYVAINAAGLPAHARYIDLWGLGDELRGIARKKRAIELGALTTYTDCIRSAEVKKVLPILVEAARQVGGVQIQNRGTLGGNIANGSPAADGVPVLMAAGARVVLRSRADGEREIPLDKYYLGYKQTARRFDELIVAIRVDVPEGPQRFRKVGTRAAQAISKVVMARVANGVAWGSVAPTVIRSPQLEAYLTAGGRDPEEARRHALTDVRPIDDVRSTAEYRRAVVGNLAATLVSI
jgi:CO/xanthine dehydrogenase FAD-binding subunit